VKITGLDAFNRQLTEAQRALEALDGELGTVNFNPNDPASIEAAITHVETMVDERVGAYLNNPIIGPIAAGMKEKYREAIIERAAQARLKAASSDE